MKVRLLAFVIWAAVAASVMFWALRLGASSPAAPAHTVAVGAAAAPRGDLTRVLGAAPARESAAAAAVTVDSPLASRFRLLGVAAPRQGGDRHGLALIAVDGKPARSYTVGASIDGELVLQSVHQRGAKLGGRGAATQVSLVLPALPAPATGSLPSAAAPPATAPPVAAPGVGVPGTVAGAAASCCAARSGCAGAGTGAASTVTGRGDDAVTSAPRQRNGAGPDGPSMPPGCDGPASSPSATSVSSAAAARTSGQASVAPVPSVLSMPSSSSAEVWNMFSA